MENFYISGIQQLGIGTVDFRKSWNWFIEMFAVDVKILEDDTVAERMLPYTGNKAQKRHACIAVNLQGGGGFEIWQYSQRMPKPIDFELSVADLGIFAAKLKCSDVHAFHAVISQKWEACSALSSLPNGKACFYVKDLYGNYFQIVEDKNIFINQHGYTGGIVGALIGVSNMDASLRFYQEILGYDKVLYDATATFDDWKSLPGGSQCFRRVLIGRTQPYKGAFSELFGSNTLELVQALDRKPRKIYEGRFWGDPGFIQICYDVTNMQQLGRFCAAHGHPFTVDSCPYGEVFDMGEASGHFTYIEDPDGTLIEFVETHKIPLIKRFGWNINLMKRNREKPLPKFLFRLMGLVAKEKIHND